MGFELERGSDYINNSMYIIYICLFCMSRFAVIYIWYIWECYFLRVTVTGGRFVRFVNCWFFHSISSYIEAVSRPW